MEVIILVIISVIVAIIILAVTIFKSKSTTKEKVDAEPADNEQGARARRVAGVRGNQRARMRANVRNRRIDEEEDGDEIIDDGDENGQGEIDTSDFDKMGAKKRAKMEAKAERKVAREMEERNREEQKKKKQAEDLDSQKQRLRELELEKQKEEEEKKLREEQERKDHEEYLKMKAAFSVEEEGYMEGDQENEENMLQNFVKHIKENKVVILEDVASVFKLKTQAVIDRIQDLIKDGILTGVIDDRGKFIYITEAELKDVAKFIKQRGRISIEELAQSSNQLIHLTTAS